MPATGFRFLYREDRGRISRGVWWRGILPLAGFVIVATVIWEVVKPYAAPDLATQPLMDVAVVLAYLVLAVYAFAMILAAVCYYNVCAKRFRDRGRRGLWAAALPLAVLLTGALDWFIPRSMGDVPAWWGAVASVVLLALLVWNVIDLGFGPTAVGETRIVP